MTKHFVGCGGYLIKFKNIILCDVCDIDTPEFKGYERKVEEVEDFIVAGTGSRSLQTAKPEIKRNAVDIVATELDQLKDKYGDRLVIMSGMAEGFDKLLAMTALNLGIRLWVAIPNKDYGNYYWGRKSLTGHDMLEMFDRIVGQAEKVIYVKEDVHGIEQAGVFLDIENKLAGWYDEIGPHSNFIRNTYMVETADTFLVWNPSSAGTADAVRKIKEAGKPFKVLSKEKK